MSRVARWGFISFLMTGVCATTAYAGDKRDDNADTTRPEIVVTAPRILGSAIDDIPPVIALNENEIEAYGASTVADLLAALAPQTQTGREIGRAHV